MLLRESCADQSQSPWAEHTTDSIQGFWKYEVEKLANFQRWEWVGINFRCMVTQVRLFIFRSMFFRVSSCLAKLKKKLPVSWLADACSLRQDIRCFKISFKWVCGCTTHIYWPSWFKTGFVCVWVGGAGAGVCHHSYKRVSLVYVGI